MPEESFAWTFKEFDQHSRGVWWYIVAGVVVALAVLYSFQTNNFLFTVIIVLTLVILFARQFQTPTDVECVINEQGIRIGKKRYSFADLASFSVVMREDGVPILYIHEARGLHNLLPLQLVDISPENLRMFLLQFLEEDVEHQHEPLWDWLMRALRL